MKGKSSFTRAEADQIIILISKKLKASKHKQKQIRDKIRRIGFYYSDFSSVKIQGGYTQDDFFRFVKILK